MAETTETTSPQRPLRPRESAWPDKIDLRRHLIRLFSWWREFSLVFVLVTALTFAISWSYQHLLSPSYTAIATVLIVSKTSELEGLPAITSRQAAMLGLVYNGKVATAVLKRIGGQLDAEERNMTWLMSSVSAYLSGAQSRQNLSDLISIKVTADSPEKALSIADTWGEEYVREVNLVWISSRERHSAVMQGITRILDEYTLAQSKLKEHITRNEINRIDRQIEEKTQEIEEVAETQRLSRTDIFNRWRLLHGLLNDARGLRKQIRSADETGVRSNGLAILLLKTRAFTYSASGYDNWEFAFDDLDAMHDNVADQRADVDAFIQMLQSQIQQIEAEIANFSDGLSGNGNSELSGLALAEGLFSQRISKLENDLQEMQRRKEEVSTERRRLAGNRDRLEEALVNLENESVEMVVEDAAANLTLRMASNAVLTPDMKAIALLIYAILAGVFGLIVAMGGALFLDSLGVRPFLTLRVASRG